eukprot:SAG22_NODE_21727_length_254_cov_1.000000_1_plen_62_part_10
MAAATPSDGPRPPALPQALVTSYLGRLRFPPRPRPPPTLATLNALTRAHIETVPYEYLDIHL